MTSEELKALDVKTKDGVKFGKELKKEFPTDNRWRNLNHGSFGTYPLAIRKALRSFQDRVEARPDEFIRYTYPKLLDESREAMSKLLNAPTAELVFVTNATTGVNIVLRSLTYEPGDHILYFSVIYGACERTVTYITETTPASAAKIEYISPVEDDWLLSAFRSKVKEVEEAGGKVKVAIFDTVVSNPGIRSPFERLTEACRELGVLSCIDGAHGVGHIELDLGKLDADFFVSNCHKWLHVPRGCAIFHVPVRNQHLIRSTLPTSHGFIPLPKEGEKVINPLPPSDTPKSDFELNFEYVGTLDNSPYLCVPAALAWRLQLGGEKAIIDYNQTLSRLGAQQVAKILGTKVLDNETRTLTKCCMANVLLPLDAEAVLAQGVEAGIEKDSVMVEARTWINRILNDEYLTFLVIMFYGGQWWVRLSAQVYLDMEDYEWAGETLKQVCERVKKGEWTVKKGLL
ncbi:PLP-dependent transferase [Massarina eburnea CBS 473.64]|uniref:PLP-dependent transferase n=1 Tax=Massarina eburnea CBS 473.64 TaxID=1395130 RepID=A0A6A6RVH9_9PLEO|nr:PLP-dependent transferase [Massarina eburnea CBS 473.64]